MRIPLALSVALLAGPALGQVVPFHGPNAVGDRHRYEMDRLRNQADQRATFARQQRLESRLTGLDLQSARQPEPVQPAPIAPLRTVEQARAEREAATRRREATAQGVGQIDAWLDRPRR